MKEKTLLAEIEEEQKRKIEESFLEHKNKNISKESPKKQFQEIKKSKEYTINPFSSSAFKDSQVETKPQPVQEEPSAKSSSVIESPNYDLIETLSPEQREKIFKIEEEKEEVNAKPKTNKFKIIMFSILFAIFGIWGIVNIATLDNISSQISDISYEYNMNLLQYLNNLHNLDITNSENMQNLFETIPKEDLPATSIGEQSNWFDRFCNFISGLFGG